MSKQISQLPAATLPLGSTDLIPISQGGIAKQTAIPNITPDLTISGMSKIIQSITVGAGGQATIVLTPPAAGSGYTNFVIKVVGRSTAAAENVNMQTQFNNDTGTNYDYIPNTPNSGLQTSQSSIVTVFNGASATANYASQTDIFADNYLGTAFYKTAMLRTLLRYLTANVSNYGAGIWKNTAAITQVTLSLSSGLFAQNTVATLTAE